MVIPLFDIVVYPHSRTKFLINKTIGELLSSEIDNGGTVYAMGLVVKSNKKSFDISEEDLFRTGNLFEVTSNTACR
jgi:ATP-dependent Lon protease